MATDINLSLDDIIKKNKSIRNFNPRRRQRQNNQSGKKNINGKVAGRKNFGGPRFRSNTNRPRAPVRFSPYKRGDIDRPWSHDLYEDSFIGKRIDYDAGGTKIIISNLEFGVTDSDLQELFMEVGPLVSSEIHYDKSGRSLGSGNVVFEDRTDAIRAINQYNGVPLDGRAMKIEIASTTGGRLSDNRKLNNFRNRNVGGVVGGIDRKRFGGNRNGSFGNRNRRSNSNLSAEQLDAELDEYRAKGL
ncbi:hypothetical protein PGB90_007859 [Kerria lacca]